MKNTILFIYNLAFVFGMIFILPDNQKQDNISSQKEIYIKNRETEQFVYPIEKTIIPQNKELLNKIARISDSKIKIGIIDTSFDYNHNEFKNLKIKKYEKNKEEQDHGTMMLSIIAGKTIGINPYVKVVYLDNLRQTTNKNWKKLLKNNVKLVNYSGGGRDTSDKDELLILKEFERRDIPIIVSAGNNQTNNDNFYPCNYKLKNIICVGNAYPHGKINYSSNYGRNVFIFGIGSGLSQAIPNNQFEVGEGTSQATAYVSGVVSLLIQIDPNMKAQEIKEILAKTAFINTNFKNEAQISGIVNMEKAVEYALEKYKNNRTIASVKK